MTDGSLPDAEAPAPPSPRDLRYLDVVEGTPDPVLVYHVGPGGTPGASPIHRNPAALDHFGPHDPPEMAAPLRDALQRILGKAAASGEPELVRVPFAGTDGELRRFRIRCRLWGGVVMVRIIDESDLWAAERLSRSRERLLHAVARAGTALLEGPWETTFDRAARILGEAAEVSRVYLFRRHEGRPEDLIVDQTHEWCAPGISSELANPELQGLDLHRVGASHVAGELLAGRPWTSTLSAETDPALLALLEAQGIRSLVGLPVMAEGRLWGYIGMDDCVRERAWSEGELEAVQAAAALLGGAVERDRSVAALRRTESRLTAAVNESMDGFLVLDGEGQLLEANPSALRIFGLAPGAPLPRVDQVLPTVDAHLLEGRRTGRGIEDRGTRPDGTPYEVELTLTELELDDRPLLALAVRDVTGRRAMEEELRSAQRLDSVGRLAGGMAHDFNNLLTVIQANLEFARMALDEGEDATSELDEARGAADRGARLIQQLLAFARRQVVQPRRLRVNALVRDFASLMERVAAGRMEVVLELTEEEPEVEIDPGQLEQVLMNLAINARDAMPNGGRFTIRTRRVDPPAVPAGFPPRPGLLLAISDTGTGIAPELQAQVFEPFFSTKPPGQGVGLGLSTVYGIVKQAGGEVALESTPGAGTTFRIFLPVAGDPVT
jgi:signal transduction histidine kinase